jgi:molybdopterin-synthase adenylyltransferase
MIGPAGSGGALSLSALGNDHNLRFPSRPRLVADLRVFEMPDGLGILVHSGDVPVVLRGQLVDRVFAFLRDNLDGSRELEALQRALPADLPVEAVARSLRVLHTKGLLVDGAAGPDPSLTPAGQRDAVVNRQLLLWGRHVGDTRAARSGEDIQRRLESAGVIVVGAGLFGAATVDLLQRSGCGRLRVLTWDDEITDDGGSTPWSVVAESVDPRVVRPVEVVSASTAHLERAISLLREWAADTDLIVTATRNAPDRLFEQLNRMCLHTQTPWLRGNVEGSTIELGPYVHPSMSACFCCVQARRRSADPLAIEHELDHMERANDVSGQGVPPYGEAIFAATLGASQLIGECVRVLTGIAMPALLNRVITLLPLTGEQRDSSILRVPRCPECSRAPVLLSGPPIG